MSAEDDLIRALRERDAAKAALDERLSSLSGALHDQGVGQRLKHDALTRAQGVAGETIAVARQSRWVIAATLLALLGWLLRNPIAAMARRTVNSVRSGEPRMSWQRLREWTLRKAKQ